MNLNNLLSIDCICHHVDVQSKKRALEVAAEALSDEQMSKRDIFDALIARERLGSTGLGHAVALPHGRMDGLDVARASFVILKQAVDFDAIDQRPVDLIFALLVPQHFTDEHLRILSFLAERFSDPDFCDQIRAAKSQQAIYDIWRAGG